MESNQQDLTLFDRMIMVGFIGLLVLECFVEHPISHINMATDFLTDFL
jgi:hypothetical protein